MRIGLLSDTHIPQAGQVLPPQIADVFQDVELILHAGDIYLPPVLDQLEHIAPVLAASGDDDSGDMLTDRRVKRRHVLKLGGKTLWLIHEMPYSYVVTLRRARDSTGRNEEDIPDIVVFGHEHTTMVRYYGSVLFINPGSPTFLNYRIGLGTVGILDIDIDSGEAQTLIVQL